MARADELPKRHRPRVGSAVDPEAGDAGGTATGAAVMGGQDGNANKLVRSHHRGDIKCHKFLQGSGVSMNRYAKSLLDNSYHPMAQKMLRNRTAMDGGCHDVSTILWTRSVSFDGNCPYGLLEHS